MKLKLKHLQAQIELWKEQGQDKDTLKASVDALTKGKEIVDDDGKPVDFNFTVSDSSNSILPQEFEDFKKSIKDAIQKATDNINAVPERIAKGLAITGGEPRNDDARSWGFKRVGDYLKAVVKHYDKHNPATDERLLKGFHGKNGTEVKAALSTYAAEVPGTDGGFLIPPMFQNEIVSDVESEQNLLSMCNVIRTSTNNVTIPTDENTDWDASGIQAYWRGEADTYNQTKPVFKTNNIILEKLTVLVPVTDEMLSDSTLIGSYVPMKAKRKMDFKLGEAIWRGTGAGMPLGFLNSASTISQAAENAQAQDTVNVQNVTKMFTRAYNQAGSYRWFIQPDVYPQLLLMTLGNFPIFTPPMGFPGAPGITASPAGTLLGKPIVSTQHANTVGDVGDIVLADLSQYMALVKTDQATQAVSTHLWFDQDTTAFKFSFRMAGQPWRSTPISSRSGTNTLSYFVTLAAR